VFIFILVVLLLFAYSGASKGWRTSPDLFG
jgi:hypothetical protein